MKKIIVLVFLALILLSGCAKKGPDFIPLSLRWFAYSGDLSAFGSKENPEILSDDMTSQCMISMTQALMSAPEVRANAGDGMDFDSLRDYLPGDDPRRVDWRATARRGRLVVRQYQHERNHTVLIAVDASRLMAGDVDGRSKLDHAVDAGLALAYAALQAGDRVGLLAFDRELRGFCAPRE